MLLIPRKNHIGLMKKIFANYGRKKSAVSSSLPATSQAYYYQTGKPVWSGRNYSKFSDEAYIRNVIAHQSVARIANAAASVTFKLKKGDGYVDIGKHAIGKLLKNPNPGTGRAEFFVGVYSFKLISGNSYILALGADAPVELHSLRPDRVSVIAGSGGMPAGYRYALGNNKNKDYKVAQVLHLKCFHPLDDWYGLAPVEAAAYSIDQHNQASAWNQALLQNGARPSGALVVKQNGEAGGNLSDEQYNRIKAQIDDEFVGSGNAGRPILLEGGLDWKEMSLSPKDMDFINAKHASARDIALAFGVPPQLLGIPGDNTYSNLQEARLALWEQTVVPLVCVTADALNRWLLPMFDDSMELSADIEGISVLALRNQAIWDRVERATFLTEDEKRAAVGYGPKKTV